MPIVGDRPESGVRIALTRPERRGEVPAAYLYEGFAHTPDASFRLTAGVTPDGVVTVSVDPAAGEPPLGLAEKVRLLVRTAFKQAASDGDPPPLRITRWRGEK